MGGDSNSGDQSTNYNFGSVSTSGANLSNFFGGTKYFNLGAGSSSNTFNLESLTFGGNSLTGDKKFEGDSSGGGVGTIAADVAASVGVGVGGGSGSAGAVDKTTMTTTTKSHGGDNESILSNPLLVGGIAISGVLAIILIKRK